MAEIWRYQDRLAAGQLPTKRPRSERDDVPSHGSAGYGRGDFRFDERDARAFDYGLDYGKAGAAFGSVGLTGAEIMGLADGTFLGAGVTGSLRAPTVGLSALEDPRLSGLDSGLLRGASAGLNGESSDIHSGQEFPEAISKLLSHPLASTSLFVEGLPVDCTRREAAHIFRRFHGYKDIRVHQKGKGSRKTGVLLCFVDFEDAFSAARALKALQGYKFDEEDPDTEPLQIQFSTRGPRDSGAPAPARRRRRRR